jgi:hypothetical protein
MEESDRDRALVLCAAAGLVAASGVGLAAVRFPGGFDWAYTVISRLGSHAHNPDGAVWLSAALLAAVTLLWPVARHLGRAGGAEHKPPKVSIAALRVGLVGGALLGLEGLFALELSRLARKAHEIVALLAVGASQLALYFDQRDLGWVNTGWRELGVPVWLSFAFWQWLAVAFLGIGIGFLVAAGARRPAADPGVADR